MFRNMQIGESPDLQYYDFASGFHIEPAVDRIPSLDRGCSGAGCSGPGCITRCRRLEMAANGISGIHTFAIRQQV